MTAGADRAHTRVSAGRASRDGANHSSSPRALRSRSDDGVILVSDQAPSLIAFAPDWERLGGARPSLNGAHGVDCGRSGEIFRADTSPSGVTPLASI